MRDPRLDKLASVLVNFSTRIKEGELVCIRADPISMPLIEATYEAILAAGAHPVYSARSDALSEIMLEQANDAQLEFVSPIESYQTEQVDVLIAFWADTNTKSMSRIDPKRSARQSAARKPLMKRFMEREAEGSLRWCGTQYPTPASAQDAEMSLRQYEDFVFRAGKLHTDDPAAEWTRLRESQQRVCDWLQSKKELRFRSPNGTDLRVDIDGAIWINAWGDSNFPDGEVFAGPQGVEGVVCYDFPAVEAGREVHDIRLEFKGGRVVDASASKNEAFLCEMLDQDEGARGLGEIAIGTNYDITEYTKNTLFDEKIGGTFHAAVGAGYPASGNSNESGLHWDMVCDLRHGGTIEADGEVFHRDGRFLNDGWPGPRPE
ncbi:MAG: aminopeptidase [Phycisphaerales bacterium]